MSDSLIDQLVAFPPSRVPAIVRDLPHEIRIAIAMRWWAAIARPEQLVPPGDWTHLWLVAGRGAGKSRTGSEATHDRVRSGRCREGALIGPTAGDTRDIMVEGPSGILRTARKGERPDYQPSKRLIRFSNGAVLHLRSGEDPDAIRGLNLDWIWGDEPGVFRYGIETRDNANLALRIGLHPQALWTTTPRRTPLVVEEMTEARRQAAEIAQHGGFESEDIDELSGEIVTVWRTAPTILLRSWSTYDNLRNLAPSFRREIVRRYEGSRLGRQELHGELLTDIGTMFRRAWFLDRMYPLVTMDDDGARVELEDPAWYDLGNTVSVRVWDLAGREPSDKNLDPDWTVGTRVIRRVDTRDEMIEDVVRLRESPATIEQTLVATAQQDGPHTRVLIEREPGASGIHLIDHYKRLLNGIAVVEEAPATGSKETRAMAFSTYAEQGKVWMRRAPWNLTWLDEAEEFPPEKNQGHDDQIDTAAHAHNWLEVYGQPVQLETPTRRLPALSREGLPRTSFRSPGPPGPPRLGRLV